MTPAHCGQPEFLRLCGSEHTNVRRHAYVRERTDVARPRLYAAMLHGRARIVALACIRIP